MGLPARTHRYPRRHRRGVGHARNRLAADSCLGSRTRHGHAARPSVRLRKTQRGRAIIAIRVGFFRRRTSSEDLVRGHLERLGISPFWLRSALDAIRHCEQGEPFEPVFSIAGPAPARSVVALMDLEPFVRSEIDWTVSPSESPLWVGSVGDLQDEVFEATTERFVELYSSAENPTIRPELERAIRELRTAIQVELVDGLDHQETSARLWSLGSAGYVWRLAESRAQTSDHNLRADLVKEVEAVVAPFASDPSDDRIFGPAAAEIVRRNLLLGSGSPGGWATGGEFLRRGFRFADRMLWPDAEAPRKARWDAFVFGVALYEVDQSLARRSAWSARHRRLSASARP
jgi:hypothetical protein